jgi:FkbM family methyltransferase
MGVVRTVKMPPIWFRLGKFLIRHRLRGGWRTLDLARRLGLLSDNVEFPLQPGYSIAVPIASRMWDRDDLLHYEESLVSAVARSLSGFSGPTVLVDCGADIGLLSVLIVMRNEIAKVFSIEPNESVFEILQHNIARLPVPGEALHAAVADFTGRGDLHAPQHDPESEHARFLVRDQDGPFEVIRIDDLPLLQYESVVLKLDIEGGEAEAVAGATTTIGEAKNMVIVLEAHPQKVCRTGVDPISILKSLAAIRPFDFSICEEPDLNINMERDFFAQFDSKRIFNLLCRSCPRP